MAMQVVHAAGDPAVLPGAQDTSGGRGGSVDFDFRAILLDKSPNTSRDPNIDPKILESLL